MRRWWLAVVVTAGVVGASSIACDLDLEPYVAPVDGGQRVALNDSGTTDARLDSGGPIDAATDAPPKDAASDASTVKRVFVTSTTVNGGLGGLAGADTRCQQLATAAKLGGTFVAWLSAGDQAAPARIQGAGPWFLVDQKTRIFATKLALTTTGPEAPIEVDEKGEEVENPRQVWTGTQANGAPSNNNCNSFAVPLQNGLAGEANKTGTDWTQSANVNCQQPLRLYCFEQ